MTMTKIVVVLVLLFGGLSMAVAAVDAGPSAVKGPADQVDDKATPGERVKDDPGGVVVELIDAIKGGKWRMVAALVLALLMLGLGKIRGKIKWFSGSRGGRVLVMMLAMLGAVSAALATDAKIDWRLFVGAAGVAWMAAGGWDWFKGLIWPNDGGGPDRAKTKAG